MEYLGLKARQLPGRWIRMLDRILLLSHLTRRAGAIGWLHYRYLILVDFYDCSLQIWID
jgi:hypothetical protein